MAGSHTKILNLLSFVAFIIMFTAQDTAISNGHTVAICIAFMTSVLAALIFIGIIVSPLKVLGVSSPYEYNKDFKRWLSWKFGILCLFLLMVALGVMLFQNRTSTLEPLKRNLFLLMVPLSVMLFQILEVERIFPSMRNKARNLCAAKHHELLTNNHKKLVKEDSEFEKRMIFSDLEVATMFMCIAFYLAFSMRKQAPSFLMVTLVLACITSFTSVLIFTVIIALGITKGTLRKLHMRCGHVTSYLLTLALLVFAFIVMSFQNSKGTVG